MNDFFEIMGFLACFLVFIFILISCFSVWSLGSEVGDTIRRLKEKVEKLENEIFEIKYRVKL